MWKQLNSHARILKILIVKDLIWEGYNNRRNKSGKKNQTPNMGYTTDIYPTTPSSKPFPSKPRQVTHSTLYY